MVELHLPDLRCRSLAEHMKISKVVAAVIGLFCGAELGAMLGWNGALLAVLATSFLATVVLRWVRHLHRAARPHVINKSQPDPIAAAAPTAHGVGTLTPLTALLPDVLQTDRLFASGKARPGIVLGLRSISNTRDAFSVVAVWAQVVAGWLLVQLSGHWVVWIIAVLWVGRCYSLVFLLNHEAAHALLFSNRSWNDRVGRLLLGWPALVDLERYRKARISHHKNELGPDEPDMGLYVGYPSRPRKLALRLSRDLRGRSAYKQVRALMKTRWTTLARIASAQAAVALLAYLTTGSWWAWLVLWWLPWATVWQVINRLRSIAEHAGVAPGTDRRHNTHIVRQSWLPSQFLAPFGAGPGYHLAHHVDTSVPWNHLPALHNELERAGWITPEITHSSYTVLWRYLTTISEGHSPHGVWAG
ncbi:MAG: fatty acid desaturase [Candidatus Poriferisodalaceae bacterium]|jgi:fatty acid desaturase